MAVIPQRGSKGKSHPTNGLSFTLNYKVDTLAEALKVAPSKEFLGIPEDERSMDQELEGQGRIMLCITYKGGSPTGKPGNGGTPPEEARWTARRVDREEPIETHPQIEKLKAKYGGVLNPQTKKIDWPETYKIGAASSAGFVGPSYSEEKNPMMNARTYTARGLDAIASYTYGNANLPEDFFDQVGKVLTKLPTARIPTKKGYVWIVMPPEADDLGPKAWKIKQPYRCVKKASYLAAIQEVTQD